MGSLGGHLGSFWGHFGGTLEPYLREFDVEKHEMASVIGICAGLVGPKSENVEKLAVFKAFFEGVKTGRRTPGKQKIQRQMGVGRG